MNMTYLSRIPMAYQVDEHRIVFHADPARDGNALAQFQESIAIIIAEEVVLGYESLREAARGTVWHKRDIGRTLA